MASTETVLAYLVGLAQMLPALLLAWAAERLPPNPLIGLRVAYTLSSERVWVRVNRLSGIVLAAVAATSIPIGLFWSLPVQAAFLALCDTATMLILVEYSRRVLERIQVVEPPRRGEAPREPLRLPAPARILVALASASSIILVFNESLRLASVGFIWASLTIASLAVATAYTAFLSVVRPEAYVRRWLSLRGAKTLAIVTPLLLSAVSAMIGLAPRIPWTTAILLGLAVAAILLALILVRLYVHWLTGIGRSTDHGRNR